MKQRHTSLCNIKVTCTVDSGAEDQNKSKKGEKLWCVRNERHC